MLSFDLGQHEWKVPSDDNTRQNVMIFMLEASGNHLCEWLAGSCSPGPRIYKHLPWTCRRPVSEPRYSFVGGGTQVRTELDFHGPLFWGVVCDRPRTVGNGVLYAADPAARPPQTARDDGSWVVGPRYVSLVREAHYVAAQGSEEFKQNGCVVEYTATINGHGYLLKLRQKTHDELLTSVGFDAQFGSTTPGSPVAPLDYVLHFQPPPSIAYVPTARN
ncbi:hypothetical protein JCM10212_002215 [Sporobolomyces blumeae]